MKTLFIINSTRRDGGMDDALVEQIKTRIAEAGIDCDIRFSGSVDECETLISTGLDQRIEALWIGGGDGSLNHALNCTVGKDIVYGIVPMGTVNALANAIGIPTDPLQAIDYLLAARPTHTDVGQLDTPQHRRYFFTYATVGIHAAVFYNIDTRLKKRWGKIAFWESAIRTLWQKSRLPRFILEMEAEQDDGSIAPVRDYGYSFNLTNVANYLGYGTFKDDRPALPGFFELHSFRRNKIMPMLGWFALLRLFGVAKPRPNGGVEIRRVRKISVRSHRRLSVQIDGEPICPKESEVTFTCLQNSVRLLLQPLEARNLKEELNE